MTPSEKLTHYRDAWLSAIYDATGDYVKSKRAIELAELNGLFDPINPPIAPAQLTLWQPIKTIPRDRPIDGWHNVWKCPVTIAYRSWGDRSAWVEKTLTTEWPIEAFTHWRETSEAPAITLHDRAVTENKGE